MRSKLNCAAASRVPCTREKCIGVGGSLGDRAHSFSRYFHGSLRLSEQVLNERGEKLIKETGGDKT
jgi:hypothetical protein